MTARSGQEEKGKKVLPNISMQEMLQWREDCTYLFLHQKTTKTIFREK